FYLACFSTAYASRKCSYMNEELILAIEELRRRRFDQAWFIPVLLDDGEIPDIPIGRGETLRSLQWVDLREDWEAGICAILNMVSPDTETIRSAPVDADRARINSTIINDVDIPSSVATTPSEYVEQLEKLMHATGHSLRSLEACAYVHGDNLPRPITKDALVKAGNWNKLPARPTVQVFVRACLCHKEDLPRALNENPLPPRDLCMCWHQDVRAWMTCYDKIASHRGAIDEWITSLWGRYRSQAANIRITTYGSVGKYAVHNLGLTFKCISLIMYSDRKSAAKALAELLQRDRHDAAAAISGRSWLIETRAPRVISQLAIDDPRAARQLFYAVAEFAPEKAVQLFERAGIPIPQSDPPHP
ncbi:MAG: hypothetical protein M3332_02290, partial [Actinomycetota bacterium]|nr:hypothetical protein [Actinomycetota bacterium]